MEIGMKEVRQEILACVNKFASQDELLISELERKISIHGACVYSLIFDVLAHLHIEPDRAEQLWHGILQHRVSMAKALGRAVGVRTAICDYLCSVYKTLENPMLVEITVFENYYQSNYFDDLTGLYSRKCLKATLQKELSRATRYHTPLSVVFFDLDDFKSINDTYGHLAGDLCLIKVACIIMGEIRAEDSAIRYGGEEILVILPQTDQVNALNTAERIRRQVKEFPFRFNKTSLQVTISGGIASFPQDGQEIDILIECADQGMYRAKAKGKDCIAVSTHEKRRYVRVNYREIIQVEAVGVEENFGGTRTSAYGKNISCSGLLFEASTPIAEGTCLKLKMPLGKEVKNIPVGALEVKPDGHFMDKNGNLTIRGVVVRNELNPCATPSYDIGVSFYEPETRMMSALSQLPGSPLDGSQLE